MRHWFVLVLCLIGLGTLRIVACGEEGRMCVEDEDCDDGNPCTWDLCDKPTYSCDTEWPCRYSWKDAGTPCGSGKVCVDGVCGENLCEGVVCDDGLDCTDDDCDFKDGECRFTSTCNDQNDCTEDICSPVSGLCDYTTPIEDGRTCSGVPGLGTCEAGVCVGPCNPASTEVLQCPIPNFEYLSCCPGWSGCQYDENPEEPGCQVW